MSKQEIEEFLDECYGNIKKSIDSGAVEGCTKAVIKANLLYCYTQLQMRFLENHNLRKFEENKEIIHACVELSNEQAVFVNNYFKSLKKP
jgi:hypothetical protein